MNVDREIYDDLIRGVNSENLQNVIESSSENVLKREKEKAEHDTFLWIHKCGRGILLVFTLMLTAFTLFLLWEIGTLINSYCSQIIDNKEPNERLITSLANIWKVVSGSSFIFVLGQALLTGLKRNIKEE